MATLAELVMTSSSWAPSSNPRLQVNSSSTASESMTLFQQHAIVAHMSAGLGVGDRVRFHMRLGIGDAPIAVNVRWMKGSMSLMTEMTVHSSLDATGEMPLTVLRL